MEIKVLYKLWQELGDISINEEEEIEERFLDFDPGTHREDIWYWFEEQNPEFSVAKAMGVTPTPTYAIWVHVEEINEDNNKYSDIGIPVKYDEVATQEEANNIVRQLTGQGVFD